MVMMSFLVDLVQDHEISPIFCQRFMRSPLILIGYCEISTNLGRDSNIDVFFFWFGSNLLDFEEGNPLLDLSSLGFEGGNLLLTTIVTRLVDFSFKFGWIHRVFQQIYEQPYFCLSLSGLPLSTHKQHNFFFFY